MAGLYSYYLAPIVLTPAQVNISQLVNTGNRLGGWLLIQNNSPYKIQVQLPGSGNYLPLDPQTVDKLKVGMGDQQIYILPLTLLPGAAPSSQVDIQVYPGDENEPPGTYPMALTRQAAPTARSSSVGFQATGSFDTIPTNSFAAFLNLNNPANSTVKATIYLARTVISNLVSTAFPEIRFGFYPGAKAVSGTGVTTPNNTTATPVCTTDFAANVNATITGEQDWYKALFPTNTRVPVFYDLCIFPDQKELPPNTNAFIAVDNVSVETIGELSLLWMEQ